MKHIIKISRYINPITSCGYAITKINNTYIRCMNGWLQNDSGKLHERISYNCPNCNEKNEISACQL